ncbi:MAG: VWA domain-containing protein [Propionibacteriaceae bacterium]|nr:VWA domain-containing protein [Propionibacteriaceae bacterium]
MTLVLLLGFLRPERLWLLLLLPTLFLLYLVLMMWRSSKGKSHPRSKLERVIPKQQAWKRHTAVLLAVLSLGSLTLAFAQPTDEVDVPRERATVVITIDVSRSMLAEDVAPTRIDAAKSAAKEFLGMIPAGFNVALVRFAATAAVVVPPTIDRGVLAAAIDRLEVAPSTATGEGIYSSLDAIQQAPPDRDNPDEVAPGAIILLSDGSRNAGRPVDGAAKLAKEMDIPIYTIAYGTADGYVWEGGSRAYVPVNKPELRRIAQLSGGESFEASSINELRQVYESISRKVGYMRAEQEVSERYAGYALVLAVLAALACISLAARWP